MSQTEILRNESGQFHIAIIMDGNGRWASRQGKFRFQGHRVGAETAKRIVEASPDLGITVLTLYAFSSDNWGRPQQEVDMLMRLFKSYLQMELANCIKNKVRLSFIGRRDRLDPKLVSAMEEAEATTATGDTLHLRIAIDYSARDSILAAIQRLKKYGHISREMFSRYLTESQNNTDSSPDVDLLIRTGGERRLSDFLLWECAYAEFYFTDTMWPDFDDRQLSTAVAEFQQRERRFGCIPELMAI
jgi:undecaprenyl diphosphate synthase